MNLTELRNYCGAQADKNGWHEDYPHGDSEKERLWIAVKAGLIAAEAHEAIEELRKGHDPNHQYTSHNGAKSEGFLIELADVVIRVLDLCSVLGLDIESAVLRKLRDNDKRGKRHGGKKL